MIMDWVLLDGTPIQVAGLHNRKVGVHKRRRSIYCSWHSDGEFRPIPLTEDILVKNGFDKKYFDYDFSYDLYEDDNVSFVRLYDHGEGVFFTETSGGDIVITYVHQLQHLLRLCGIEKEIEL